MKVAKTRTPVPKPISMPSSASGKDMSKTVSLGLSFHDLPGTEAPLIPLTAYHLNNVGVGLSATSDGRDHAARLSKRRHQFETMLLQTHTMAEAHKEGQKMYRTQSC